MTKTSSAYRAAKFVAKARRQMDWAERWLNELRDHGAHGRVDDLERIFFAALATLASTHEALRAAARQLEQHEWRKALETERQTDPLLRYFWLARNAESHNDVVKWHVNGHSMELRVVDAAKTNLWSRLFYHPLYPRRHLELLHRYLYGVDTMAQLSERIKADRAPIPERIASAGVEVVFAVQSLALQDFTFIDHGKVVRVASPTSHSGKTIAPFADVALAIAIKFYRSKAVDLGGNDAATTAIEELPS